MNWKAVGIAIVVISNIALGAPPITVEQALESVNQEAYELWQKARDTAYRYPQAKNQINWELQKRPSPWYQAHLYDLTVVQDNRTHDPEGNQLPVYL